ncbi:uncharacterized protein LOC117122976, partial [Anneissia japonica]|uniref:uncharacterized protein LOC117122976 n=1 Tax=Anneissia japonica TaxID=1529436 RepID=UPI001425822B
MNYYLIFVIGLCSLIKASCCSGGHQCKNVSKTLYVINGGSASTSFYSDNFVELRCYYNDNIVFNSGHMLPFSRFRLQNSSNLFTIVISSVTTNGTYRCLVLETLGRYNITIQLKIHVDEVQLSVIPIAPIDGNNINDATNGYVVLKCHTTSPYLYTSLEFHFNSSMDAQLIYEDTSVTNDINLYHVVKILALKTDKTHDNEAIFCSAEHNITNASTHFNSPTLKLNTYRCKSIEPVRSVRIENVTADSFILKWESNTISDCGGTILFAVECITPLPSIWSEPIEIEGSNSSQKQSLSFENLNPGTVYGFVIYVRNHDAESGGSYIFSRTKDNNNYTVYMPQSYRSTINENHFTVTEIASIVLALLLVSLFTYQR